MKFLVLCSPNVRVLTNKYFMHIPASPQGTLVVKKFNAHQVLSPEESKIFIQVLAEIQANLLQNNIVARVPILRKLVGSGPKWKGLLNLLLELKHKLYIYLHEPGSIQNFLSLADQEIFDDRVNVRVIAPLSFDEMEEIYSFFHTLIKIPVYPFVQNFITSKWLMNFTFAPYAPRTFFFPQDFSGSDFVESIQAIAREEHIEYLIIKDEFDFDLQVAISYLVTSVNNIHQFLTEFEDKIEGISNYGGIVLEEFLTSNNKIIVNKSHIFKTIIPNGDSRSTISLKPFSQGGPWTSFIENVIDEKTTIPPAIINQLNPLVDRYYFDMFSSIDYIIQNNVPRVIDVNSVANCFGYVTPPNYLDIDEMYKCFISKVAATKNDEGLLAQAHYQSAMTRLYQAIRRIGPAFISGERTIRLTDMMELSLKNIIEENFH